MCDVDVRAVVVVVLVLNWTRSRLVSAAVVVQAIIMMVSTVVDLMCEERTRPF